MARQEYSQELRELIYKYGSDMSPVSYTWLRDKLSARGYWLHEDTVRRIFLAERKRRSDGPTFTERVRDNQRLRVYRLDRFVRDRYLKPESLADQPVRELIGYAHDVYGVPWTGAVSFQEQRDATWNGGRNTITIPKWARNRVVIAHEAAHSLKDKIEFGRPWDARALAAHGPEMARIMIELWEMFEVLPATDALAHATTYRVKVSDEPRFQPTTQRLLQAAAQEMTTVVITTDSTGA